MTANDRQVDGTHYTQEGTIQHWDFAASQNFDYFQGQITKYVTRWRKKNGIKDLEKAKHFLEKYIELESKKLEAGGVKQFGFNNNSIAATKADLAFAGYNTREMPPKIDNTGQKHPFGWDSDK